jgi:hypothetical protein
MHRNCLWLQGLALVLGLSVLSGCGNNNPTAPQPQVASTTLSTQCGTQPRGHVDLHRNWHRTLRGGRHVGELKALEVEIAYLNPRYLTPEGYPAYFIADQMNFEVRVKNTSHRIFRHLDITGIQEYHESGICDRWWYPYPEQVAYTQGEALPGDSTTHWENVEIRPNSEIVLTGSYTSTPAICTGLDQTHVIIQHTNSCRGRDEAIYNNPQAALFCPPAPAR